MSFNLRLWTVIVLMIKRMYPLRTLFHKSIDAGTLPIDRKMANITPIFKKGSTTDAGYYRPVCLARNWKLSSEDILLNMLNGADCFQDSNTDSQKKHDNGNN